MNIIDYTYFLFKKKYKGLGEHHIPDLYGIGFLVVICIFYIISLHELLLISNVLKTPYLNSIVITVITLFASLLLSIYIFLIRKLHTENEDQALEQVTSTTKVIAWMFYFGSLLLFLIIFFAY